MCGAFEMWDYAYDADTASGTILTPAAFELSVVSDIGCHSTGKGRRNESGSEYF